jgi:hypothetical protein
VTLRNKQSTHTRLGVLKNKHSTHTVEGFRV